ncbi:SPOR domain-containing protein [Pseudoalteromonas sp. DL-6]|uniref:SPOR domain-containing protein n=1 Tax=Pseudoalteromonas sp. DL-6 TaxID=1390185 RepID=UPI001F0F7621|nr:SPOR domain-containing protein [Pseudoalteromonas sp. DL-6]
MLSNPQSDDLVSKKDIKPYLEQWDNNKEQIARLSTMEEDLSLLIQALSAQTDIDTVPEPMKEKIKRVEYGSKQPLQPSSETVLADNTTSTNKAIYGVQIGRYLISTGAKRQVQRLKEQYPQLNSILKYRINEQQKESTTFYDVVAGPLKNQQQAAQLCLFFYKIGNKCTLAAFSEGV